MNFWQSLWPWLAGAGVLAVPIVALIIFNPLAAARLASSVSGFLQDGLRRGIEWARDPRRDWWKIGCLTFATMFLLAAFYADAKRREVVVVRDKCEADAAVLVREKDAAAGEAKASREGLQACKVALEEEVGRAQEVERENAEAVARVEAARRRAAAEAAEWRRRYDTKSPSCKAALEALEGPCASLSGY